jgi:methyl-accepting chemotaxis protein
MKKYSLYHIIGGILIFALSITIFVSYFAIKQQKNLIVSSIVEQRINLARSINDTIVSPIDDHSQELSDEFINQFLRGMSRTEDIRFIEITDENGKILFSSKRSEVVPEETIETIEESMKTRSIFFQEIFHNDESLKTIIFPGVGKVIVIGFSIQDVESSSNNWTIIILSSTVSILFLTFLLFYLVIDRTVISPVKKLSDSYMEISKRNASVEVKPKGSSEIVSVINSFNKMARDIESYRIEIEGAKEVLEEKVKKRTEEIAKLNETLEEKVKKRTIELEKKIKELEKFHRLTIGRELRMIEMKKEMKKIEEKIKKISKEK